MSTDDGQKADMAKTRKGLSTKKEYRLLIQFRNNESRRISEIHQKYLVGVTKQNNLAT